MRWIKIFQLSRYFTQIFDVLYAVQLTVSEKNLHKTSCHYFDFKKWGKRKFKWTACPCFDYSRLVFCLLIGVSSIVVVEGPVLLRRFNRHFFVVLNSALSYPIFSSLNIHFKNIEILFTVIMTTHPSCMYVILFLLFFKKGENYLFIRAAIGISRKVRGWNTP